MRDIYIEVYPVYRMNHSGSWQAGIKLVDRTNEKAYRDVRTTYKWVWRYDEVTIDESVARAFSSEKSAKKASIKAYRRYIRQNVLDTRWKHSYSRLGPR